MNFVEFQDFLALPFVVSKKGSMFQRPVSKKGNHPFAVHDIITFRFSFVSSFIMS